MISEIGRRLRSVLNDGPRPHPDQPGLPAVAPITNDPPAWSRDVLQLSDPLPTDPDQPVFANVPAAESVEESKALLNKRRQAVLQHTAAQPLQDWSPRPRDRQPRGPAGGPIPNRANARLTLDQDVARIDQLFQSGKPYSDVGTDYSLLPGIGHLGDYDFSLISQIPFTYNHWQKLSPETRQHLAAVLLNQEGAEHIARYAVAGIVPETENHILMTESSRYLKNQLAKKYGPDYSTNHYAAWVYDNQANGFNDWMVNHLSGFLRRDFDEYNSKPYQPYAIKAIQNLELYAEDPRVKTSAQIVLDYQAARFALQSLDLRRSVPFRRRPEYLQHDNLLDDGLAARYALLAGNYSHYNTNLYPDGHLSDDDMIVAALGDYRIPDAILDLMIDKGHNPYFEIAHHRNSEIVYAEKNFLISAGGHYHRWSDLPFSGQENGLVMPTVIMLRGGSPRTSEMIRFLGRGDSDRLNNTGVFENFAFGIRPVLPPTLVDQARRAGKLLEQGNWTFLEAGDVYLAMLVQSRPDPDNYAPSEGFVEVVDRSAFPSLQSFAARVRSLNPADGYQYFGPSRYATTRGKTIEFVMAEPLVAGKPPQPAAVNQWLVRRVWERGREMPLITDLDRWPLLGSYTLGTDAPNFVIRADGTSQVLINNPYRHQSLILSLADHLHPVLIEQHGEIVDLAETATVSRREAPNALDARVDLKAPEQVRYLSLKWRAGSRPSEIGVYVLEEGSDQWRLVEERSPVFTSDSYDFRTDFDLADASRVRSVRFLVEGESLILPGNPEVYRAWA